MNSAKGQLMNLPIRELLPTESRADASRTMANRCGNRVGSRVAQAPPGVGAFRFRITSYLNAWEQ
jgi:hypothetical protein